MAVKPLPIWLGIVASLIGGPVISTQYIEYRLDALDESIKRQWQVKANKEYVDLKIQALCR